MSTHNICIHAEIREIAIIFGWKKFLSGAMHNYSQWRYLIMFGNIWMTWCDFIFSSSANLFPHCSQAYGFSPVCICSSLIILAGVVKVLGLTRLSNFFGPFLPCNMPLVPEKEYKMDTFNPCWTPICPAFANSVDPDQLASEEANWSGSALFVIKYMKLYQQPGLSNLIG